MTKSEVSIAVYYTLMTFLAKDLRAL